MNIIMPWGKHAGMPLDRVPRDYCRWLLSSKAARNDWVKDHREEIRWQAGYRELAGVSMGDPNADQALAIDGLSKWLKSRTPCARLQGGAGVGKTWTIRAIALHALRNDMRVNACAVSKRASEVLGRYLDDLGVESKTLARALQLEAVITGPRKTYWPSTRTHGELKSLLARDALLIVDECSMVEPRTALRLIDSARERGGHLLVVGDAAQLPPVGESRAGPLTRVEPSWTLLTPVRFPVDSDLSRLERVARDGGDVTEVTGDQIYRHATPEEMLEQYVSDYRQYPAEELVAMAYTRRDTGLANSIIRRHLYGEAAAAVEEGESVVVLSTQDVDEVRWYSGTRMHVDDLTFCRIDGIESYLATIQGVQVPLRFMLSENRADPDHPGGEQWTARAKEWRTWCANHDDWAPYHEWLGQWVPVGYGYASTVHRLQGESIDRGYFVLKAVRRGPDARQLAYVAATRARRAVHMVA